MCDYMHQRKWGIPNTVSWGAKVLRSFCAPWRLNLHTKRGQEEKLVCGVMDSPRTHKQLCINKESFVKKILQIKIIIKKFRINCKILQTTWRARNLQYCRSYLTCFSTSAVVKVYRSAVKLKRVFNNFFNTSFPHFVYGRHRIFRVGCMKKPGGKNVLLQSS